MAKKKITNAADYGSANLRFQALISQPTSNADNVTEQNELLAAMAEYRETSHQTLTQSAGRGGEVFSQGGGGFILVVRAGCANRK